MAIRNSRYAANERVMGRGMGALSPTWNVQYEHYLNQNAIIKVSLAFHLTGCMSTRSYFSAGIPGAVRTISYVYPASYN